MYRQFNIRKFYVLPTHSVFMCFVWISEQTAIISLYSFDWLVFITEAECVYCAVRTEFLIQVILVIKRLKPKHNVVVDLYTPNNAFNT
jgi:hypothetical protein